MNFLIKLLIWINNTMKIVLFKSVLGYIDDKSFITFLRKKN